MKKRFFLSLILLLILLTTFAGVAMAQEGGPDPNNPHGLTPEQQALAKEIQQELWCPICQGVRLDVCEQKVCQQMRDMIDEMLLEGKTKQEIIDEFVVQYGVVILGEPPKQGINWMAWLMPLALVLAGLGVAVWMSRKWTQHRGVAEVGMSVDSPSPSTVEPSSDPLDDAYLARVEQELEDYES